MCLNDGKTEFVVALTHQVLKQYGLPTSIVIGDATIIPTTSVRNVGAYFDIHMTMVPHIDAICKKCNYHLRRISSIRAYINKSLCHSIIMALVVSNLDYCNSLLLDVPDNQLSRLQRIHNRAARLVTLTALREHITPVLAALHWLPVAARIEYKTLVYVYKAVNGLAPVYISELLTFKSRHSRLRQLHDHLQLSEPRSPLVIGKRAFGNTAPVLWNRVPLSLRDSPSLLIIKKQLKTYLFVRTYQ